MQCQRMSAKATGAQCRRAALAGERFCHKHLPPSRRHAADVTVARLPLFYRDKMSQSLFDAVQEQLNAPAEEQLSLHEELALMRSVAGDAVELYSVAKEKKTAIDEAAQCMSIALRSVASICSEAARIEALRKDAITPLQLQQVCRQIIRLFYTVCPDEALARKFEDLMTYELRLLKDGSTGTTLDPTQDVSAMLATIPMDELDELERDNDLSDADAITLDMDGTEHDVE